jgi:FkbM family methyltransferase
LDRNQIVVRKGITFALDLSEGIDLSIFLFGTFQQHVFKNSLPPDAVVLDIGANLGFMSLSFARQLPLGRVYAFEPTHYAFTKLLRNLELNPDLAKCVFPVRSFVADSVRDSADMIAYSSWKVDFPPTVDSHRIHQGIPQNAVNTPTTTIDVFVQQQALSRVDMIKVDTDGYELDILLGAKQTIAKFRPRIIFEVGLYLLHDRNVSFDLFLNLFDDLGYDLHEVASCAIISKSNYKKRIPVDATIDVLALPRL